MSQLGAVPSRALGSSRGLSCDRPSGADASFVASVLTPDQIGPYALKEVIGRGSSGVVFRAVDEVSGDEVALKLLDEATNRDPMARARFARERELVGAFSHPGLVRLQAAGATAEGVDYLVMELAVGQTLKERLRSAPRLGVTKGLEVVVAAADALAVMHRARWVHRDVKPANLVLDAEDRPRLLDFGLAAKSGSDAESRLTAVGFFVGTPLYLAPEQLLGERPAPTMDVYALAAMLFEILTGTPPFTGPTEGLLAAKATREAPAYEGPAAIAGLLRASLSRRPGDRPPDADAFAEELKGILAPTLERTEDIPEPSRGTPDFAEAETAVLEQPSGGVDRGSAAEGLEGRAPKSEDDLKGRVRAPAGRGSKPRPSSFRRSEALDEAPSLSPKAQLAALVDRLLEVYAPKPPRP